MGVRSGQAGGVFKPVFDATKSKGGRRQGASSSAPVFRAVTWNPELTSSVAPNLAGTSGADLTTVSGFTKSGTTGGITLNGSGKLNFTSSDGTGAAYAYDTGSTTRFIEVEQDAAAASNVSACIAVQDANNFLGVRWTASGVNIVGKIAGAFVTDTTVVSGGSSIALAPGWASSTVRIEIVNNITVRYYVNGVVRFTGTLPAGLAANTKVGLVARNSDVVAGFASNITIGVGRINHGHTQGIGQANQSARSLYANGKVFLGVTQWSQGDNGTPAYGKSRAISIDAASGATAVYDLGVGAGWGDGSHAAGSIAVRPDGRLIATYSQHSDTTGVRFRISVNPYDVSAWSQEYVIPGTGGTFGATYTNALYMTGPGKFFCFFRGTDLGSEYVTSTDILTVAPASADAGALGATPTWSALSNLIPLPSGSAKGIYTSIWSDGVNRLDFIANNAVDATGTNIDVRHAYFDCTTLNLYNSAGAQITSGLSTTYGAMTAIATTAAPDNFGNTFGLDINRRVSGLIEAIFYRNLGPTDHRYYYATYQNGQWSKTELDAGQGGGTPDSRSGTIDTDNTGGSVRVGGAALDANTAGLIYVSVGNHAQTDLYAYATGDGLTFTRTKVSPPALLNPTNTPRQVLSANVYPTTPRNAPAKAAVLWSRGRWDYYDTTTGYAYALDVMSAGLDGTTLVP